MTIPRRRGALIGLLLVILGAWGGLIPFVGPSFNYTIGPDQSWHWTSDRFLLEVLPAAAVVLGGLMLMLAATPRRAGTGALLALAGGIWFLIGPTMSMLWNDGALATGQALGASGTRVAEWVGYFYGIGAVIAALASYALGRLAAPVVTTASDEPGAGPEPDARRRRLPRFRRRRTREPVAASDSQ
jgi:hypothetical protein